MNDRVLAIIGVSVQYVPGLRDPYEFLPALSHVRIRGGCQPNEVEAIKDLVISLAVEWEALRQAGRYPE